MPNRSDGGD